MTSLILIASSILIISGCAGAPMPSSAPRPPAVLRCPIISGPGFDPYLSCQWSTGGKKWNVPIDKNLFKQDEYVCTNATGYKNGENYIRSLSRWAANHCK